MNDATKMQHENTSHTDMWHAMEAEDAIGILRSEMSGLPGEEAARRLGEYGPNRLPGPAKRSALVRLLLHFHNVLIYVLLGSALITALLGHFIDMSVILAVVVANAIIGFVQEGKAEMAYLRPCDQVYVPKKGFSFGDILDVAGKISVFRVLFGSPF